MDYRIQPIKDKNNSINDHFLILDHIGNFVAKFYSRYDAETCRDALQNRRTPDEHTGKDK